MPQTVDQLLTQLTQRYLDAYEKSVGHLPISSDLAELESPCKVKLVDDGVMWRSVTRQQWADFSNVENGIEISLNDDAKTFFSCQYSGDITVAWQGKPLTLIQVWSDEDFVRLQENMLGHLVTQRRLKLKPTLFIGTIESEIDVISVCNITGNVLLERLGTDQREVLADNLAEFLSALDIEVIQ